MFKKGQVPHNKGKPLSRPTKLKLSKMAIGRKSGFKGKKHTEKTKAMFSIQRRGKPNPSLRGTKNGMYGRRGESCPAFKGGLNTVKYPREFSLALKEDIRRRDNRTCRCCGLKEEENINILGTRLAIHHIDYNKQNCKEMNLITVCQKCNIAANYNRDYWYAFYRYIMDN